jgi:phytanoyl-CoA hydroxylase
MLATSHPACPTQLSREQIAQYQRDGYLAFVDVLTPEEVEEARRAISQLVQRVATEPNVNRKGSFWVPPNSKFGVQFETDYVPDNTNETNLELKVRKLMWYVDEHPHFVLLGRHHPKVQGVLQSLLGANPILYQDMALVKPPFIGSEKPWHQDNAYFSVTPLEAICGVWIALDDATVQNGCMHTIAGGHKLGALRHHHDRDCEIVPDRLADQDEIIPIELPAGGAMFFSGMLPHQTPPNSSPARRRALQFHYRAADSIIHTSEEYFKIFAEADGSPASCAAAQKRGL